MTTPFHVIIPARFQSSRFPGKLLKEIHGVSVIQRVYEQARKANPVSILIATDSNAIAEHVRAFGADVVMTDETHPSGTDRIAEVIQKHKFLADDIIVNVQGDEPFMPPELIRQVADSLAQSTAPMATLCWPIETLDDLMSPHTVKVVRNCYNYALYFSRSSIPFHRDNPKNTQECYRHIGIYAYRASFVLDYVQWPACDLERFEALEQLRVLWAGVSIKVDKACVAPFQDINTEEDLVRAHTLPK